MSNIAICKKCGEGFEHNFYMPPKLCNPCIEGGRKLGRLVASPFTEEIQKLKSELSRSNELILELEGKLKEGREGWRLLHQAEVLRDGDRYLAARMTLIGISHSWFPVHECHLGQALAQTDYMEVCRRISLPVVKESLNAGWVSVKEKLPPHGLRVLAHGIELPFVAYYNERAWAWFKSDGGSCETPYVWQPIPPPPSTESLTVQKEGEK